MVAHNNQIHNQHFHKHWARNVKTWFDQPAAKKRRRLARVKKATLIAPRPVVGALRPVVHSQTQKYNAKVRAGRGFTLAELKEAGISAKLAPTIGIAVDHRRRNRSVEGLQANVQRLKTYKSKLIVFPKKHGKTRKGDSTAEEIKTATQHTGALLPITQPPQAVFARAITAEERKKSAYATIRMARSVQRHAGKNAKRAAEKASADAMLSKKPTTD